MADFPFIVDINEQNLTEILQQSLEKPLIINFYAPTHKESSIFTRQPIKNRRISWLYLSKLQNNIKDNLFLEK